MRKIALLLGAIFLLWSFSYAGDVSVKGYYRKDGTYVAPYHRSSPDNTVENNYDYKGNVNPYTGQTGHNYYRDNPTSQYYGTSSSNRSSNYNQDVNTYNRDTSYSSNNYYSTPNQGNSRSPSVSSYGNNQPRSGGSFTSNSGYSYRERAIKQMQDSNENE